MSGDKSFVPTNLHSWPQVANLLPELKLINSSLWHSRYLSCAGAGLVPLRLFATELGFSTEALRSGFETLDRAGLISVDEATAEVFILDWFRWNEFRNGKSFGMLLNAIAKIQSQKIRDLVLARIPAAPAYLKQVNDNGNGGAAPARAPAPATGDEIDEATGVILRDASDHDQLAALIKTHGTDVIKTHADTVRATGGRPFVSSILAEIRAAAPKKLTAAEAAKRKQRGLDGGIDNSRGGAPAGYELAVCQTIGEPLVYEKIEVETII